MCQGCRPSRLAGLQYPARFGPQETGAFDETEEVVLLYEQVEVAGAVSTVLVVFEIKPKPSVVSAIQDVDCPGLRISRDHDKQKNSGREFDPSNDLGCVCCND